jgi:hypothetical protein
VPVPLALALGKELGKALIKMWKEEEGAEENTKDSDAMEVDEA